MKVQLQSMIIAFTMIFSIGSLLAQTGYTPAAGSTVTYTPVVGDTIYDPGGPGGSSAIEGDVGNYPNCNCITSITLQGVTEFRFDFFFVNAYFDWIRIYDGNSSAGTLLFDNGTSGNPFYNDAIKQDIVDTKGNAVFSGISGDMYLEFRASSVVDDAGYAATITRTTSAPTCTPITFLTTSNETQTTVDLSWTAGGSETSWDIEYGPTGFNTGSGTVVNTTTNPHTLTGLVDNTDYDIYVKAICGVGDEAAYVGRVELTTLPSCPEPTNLSASNPTTSSVDLAWTNGASETAWNIEYGTVGFTQGTGTVVAANSNPFTVTGLNSSTEYEFYIQADCGAGDLSNWNGSVVESTSCLPFSAPYLESFSSGALPLCFNNFSLDGSTSANALWKFTGNPGSGAGANGKPSGTFAWVDGSTPDDSQTVLESNWIDLTGLTNPMLSFELFSNNTTNPGDNMTFHVEVDDGSTTTNIFTYAGDSSEWMLQQLDLSAYVGQTVRFNFIVDQTTAGTAFYNDILLDEVAVCETEDAGFTYNNPIMCIQSNSEMPNISGMAGGTFEAPAGLDIDVNTGEINPSNSTPGVYDVTYSTSTDPCRGTEMFTVEVVSFEDASFDYAETELCPLDNNLTANVTGLSGGTFSSGAGLDLDPNTGEIDPFTSTPGVYTVTYTSSTTACATSETFDIEIIEGEDASFGYDGTEFCINYEDVVPTITGDQGGVFSCELGMAINALTGQVGAEASTPGTYWVYYTTSGNTGCVGVDSVEITIDECLGLNENAMSSISVYPNPANEVLNYVLPEMTGAVNVTMMDATGKVVYENQVNGNAGSQEINVAKFENGMYMITFKNNDQVTTKRIVISR